MILDKPEKELVLYLISHFVIEQMKKRKKPMYIVDYDWTLKEMNDLCNKIERG